ncbi:Phosphorylated carbohydrates phosphatase [Candidatus Rubidus massiliensis]|nr:Phosphorylated carbohydrates phosphatase [Candidatus Rubidus massiliensis]
MQNYFKILYLVLFVTNSYLSATIVTPYGDKMEAIIFDCDGVLVDTEYLKFLAWQEALGKKNIEFRIDEYKPLVGLSSESILTNIKKLKNIHISDDVIATKNGIYKALQKQGIPPIETMIAFVKYLVKNKDHFGIKLGLASSAPKEEILFNLKEIGLENAFDAIISGSDDLNDYEDAQEKNKPKPYIYIEAAKQLRVLPSKCLVFEDTAAGIEAAVRAQMVGIAVPNQFTLNQDFSKARKVIHTPEELSFSEFVKD